MRENTKYVLYFLVLSFGVLWMLQDTGMFDVVGSTGTDIIVVDGDAISYEQYRNVLDNQLEIYQRNNGESMSPQMLDNTRDMVYNQLVDGLLIEHEMDRLGITVTDEELYDLVLGDNPHPMVVSTPAFSDGQGGVDRNLIRSYLEDAEASQSWVVFEEQLRDVRRREKLQKLMEATVHVSNQDVEDEYQRRNRKVNTRYIALRYAAVPDDSIAFADRDVRRYYDEHREDFKQKETYTLKYVSVPRVPSKEDTLAILNELEQLKTNFAQAENDSLFLSRYASDIPYSSAFFRADDLDKEIAGLVYDDLTPGRIVGPLLVGDSYRMIKIQATRPGDEVSIRARHILFRVAGSDDNAKNQARQQATEVRDRIRRGEDFATMAKLYSSDNSNASKGGDLGWFGRGAMVEPFDKAAFDARVGQVVGPVETNFGYHLIEVLARSNEEVQLAVYAQRVTPSIDTESSIIERLDDLLYFATEADDFAGEAERRNLTVSEVQVQKDQAFIPGIGNSRMLHNLMEAGKVGALSEVVELDNSFILAQLVDVKPEGYRSFEEVKAEIEPRAKLAMKEEIQYKKLADAVAAGGFEGAAAALGTTHRVASLVTYNTRAVSELGNDLAFKGTVLAMDQGETSGVIKGANAAFIVQVTEVVAPPALGDAQREQLRNELLTQRRQLVTSQWLTALREQADVDDRRRLFLQ
ncbi:MAG: peptidylprolyl isomerase [Rhodothermales bacterium]